MLDILLLVFAIGLLTKLSDFFADRMKKSPAGYVSSALYGILSAYVIVNYPVIAPLGTAVLLSVVFTKKIDHPVHFMGIGFVILTFAFLGLPAVDIPLTLFFLAGGILDEIGNDLYDRKRLRGAAGRFFEYRLTMEAFTLAYSAISGSWTVFIAMLVFDTGYEITGKLTDSKGYKHTAPSK